MNKKESLFNKMMEDKKFKEAYVKDKKRIEQFYPGGVVPLYTIDRAVVILKRRQPFLDWLKALPSEDLGETLESINEEPGCYLIPMGEELEPMMENFKALIPEIFQIEMEAYWTDVHAWEKDLSWENFKKWFSYEICDMPIDMGEDEIFKDEY